MNNESIIIILLYKYFKIVQMMLWGVCLSNDDIRQLTNNRLSMQTSLLFLDCIVYFVNSFQFKVELFLLCLYYNYIVFYT